MKTKLSIFAVFLTAAMILALAAAAKTVSTQDSTPSKTGSTQDATKDTPVTTPATAQTEQSNDMRLEGEKRFRANCGRCHTAPPKFPPRMMGTIVRHMRVRATLTDQDTKLILRYMTQ